MFKIMLKDDDAMGGFGICFDSLFNGMGNCFEGCFGGIARMCGK